MNQPQMEIVTKLGPYDVLFGRGSGPNDHEGNVRFRKLVAERKSEYMATNHRMTKAKIAREIVDAVFIQNGRFLKKIEAEDARIIGLPDGVEAWTGVDDDTIMEKAKQALRQNTNKGKGSTEPIPLGPQGVAQSMGMQAPNALSMQQQQQMSMQNAPGMNAARGSSIGYIVEDLEPIPIPSADYPSSDYPANTVIPSPIAEHPQQQQPVQANYGQQQQQFKPAPATGQNSMKPPAPRTSIRSSISSSAYRSLMDKSLDMGDLMDSFSRTHLGNEERQKDLGNSIETMGTIDPMSVGSQADMSLATMNSSVFSTRPDDRKLAEKNVFASANERSFSELEIEEPPSYIQAYKDQVGVSDFMSSARMGLASDASMTIGDLQGRGGGGSGNKKQPSAVALKDVKEEGHRQVYDSILGEEDPPPPDASGIEAMGVSSLNLLKGMLMSQDEILPSDMKRNDNK
eukprot:CAMPEP_0172442632 /NCGR_PEP_ID=MMETSP1065-20121228/3031_1 /TAXON_ID=265537 /ORGANISM="Amphiprora paludosa, Strain CCMP125" /LENGTH=456 /DNA_ID=CAMNT_0013192573 /DNA_START=207 /DNA_END=1580 /DNA_ORIENTATION=-